MQTPPAEIDPNTQPNREASRQAAAGPAVQQPNSLKLINMSTGADRKSVILHFLTHGGQVLTVQLEMDMAIRFHRGLGGILERLSSAADNDVPKWH